MSLKIKLVAVAQGLVDLLEECEDNTIQLRSAKVQAKKTLDQLNALPEEVKNMEEVKDVIKEQQVIEPEVVEANPTSEEEE